MGNTLHDCFWHKAVVVLKAGADTGFVSFAITAGGPQRWELQGPSKHGEYSSIKSGACFHWSYASRRKKIRRGLACCKALYKCDMCIHSVNTYFTALGAGESAMKTQVHTFLELTFWGVALYLSICYKRSHKWTAKSKLRLISRKNHNS